MTTLWAKSTADRRYFISRSDARIIMGNDESWSAAHSSFCSSIGAPLDLTIEPFERIDAMDFWPVIFRRRIR
jgi:hypothetical protein